MPKIQKFLLIITVLFSITACEAEDSKKTMDKNYTDTHTAPKAFDPNRRQFDCKTWTEPTAPDEASAHWYKAGTTLYTKGFRKSSEEYQKMLMLYEAAAKKGHYKAVKDLVIIYNSGGGSMEGRFLPEPQKARYWLHYGLEKNWAGAFEWLSNALHYGNAGYPVNEGLSLAYLQKAADLGVPFAQFELGNIYIDQFDRMDIRLEFLECSANQGFSLASEAYATYYEVNKKADEALEFHQRAIMSGGETAGEAAMVLSGSFAGEEQFHDDLKTPIDMERSKAYSEIRAAILGTENKSGNVFYKFPKLNEVLPLPPAQMPPWKGIYSAMSDDDVQYYQNPPDIDRLLQEIKEAGLLVDKDYISHLAPEEETDYENVE